MRSDGSWQFKIKTFREYTGQWATTWPEMRAGKFVIPKGAGCYADTEELAVSRALLVISQIIFDDSEAKKTTKE